MNDDILVAQIVSECLHIMGNAPTHTKMTACFNLSERVLRLFCIRGKKEDVLMLIDDFQKELKKSIEEYY